MAKKSIEILGLIQSTVNPKNTTIRGYNSDSGIAVGVNGDNIAYEKDPMFPHNRPQIDTDLKANRKRKTSIFNFINNNEEVKVPVNVDLKNPDVSSLVFGTNNYSREEILDIRRRVKSVKAGKGALYSFDIETVGSHPALAQANTPIVNTNNYAITEASLWKTTFENDKPIKTKVFSMVGAPADINLDEILKAKHSDQTTNVMLQRLAGYSGDGAIIKDGNGWKVAAWTPSVDTTNSANIRKGINNLQKTGNIRGKKPYIENINSLVEALKGIGDNDILTTVNGTGFDIPQVLAEAKTYGINTDGVFNGDLDIQRIQRQFLSESIYEKTSEFRANGVDVDDSLALENLNKILLEKDKELKKEVKSIFGEGATSHIADYDTFMTMAQSTSTFDELESFLDKYADTSMAPMDISDDTVFISNGKFVSKESSLHFKTQNGVANEYNQSIIGRDRAYKMTTSKVVVPDGKEYDEAREALKNVDGKYMVELKDLTEEGQSTYMFYDDSEGIQKDLIDSGLLEPTTLDDKKISILERSIKSNAIDDLDRDMRGFGSVTSWKKVDKFENFLSQYNDLQKFSVNGEVIDKDRIASVLNGEDIVLGGETIQPKEVLTYGDGASLSVEGKKLFKEMYGDLDSNHELYNRVLETIKSTQSGEYIATDAKLDEHLKHNKIDDMTASFGSTMRDLEEEILEGYSPKEKMEYIINSDPYMKKRYRREVRGKKISAATKTLKGKYNQQELGKAINGVVLSEDEQIELMGKTFRARHRQDLDLESNIAKNILKGKKEVNSRHIATSIDILSPDGEYNLLTFGKKENFEKTLSSRVNRVQHSSKISNATKQQRLGYTSDIANDLYHRGLISIEDVESINKRNSISGRVSAITNKLYGNKDKADEIIERASKSKGYNSAVDAIADGYKGLKNLYSENVISDEDFNIAKPFIDKRIMSEKFVGNRREIMGIPLSVQVKNLEEASKITLEERVVKNTKRVSPNFSIVGGLYNKEGFQFSSSFEEMYDELGWSNSNKTSFENLISSYDFNRPISLKNSGGSKVGLNKFIINEGGDYKLVMGTNLEYIKEQISKGVPTEEYLDKAVVFKLPKVEEKSGTRFISQSGVSKKVVSNRIVAVPTDGSKGMVYKYKDTVDEVLDMFKGDLPYVVKGIEDRKVEWANSRSKRSWNKINENKTLTGNTHVYKKEGSNIVIDSEFIPNRADISKSKLINHSAIVYEMDNLYQTSPIIKEKLDNMYGSEEVQKLMRSLAIEKNKNNVESIADLPGNLGFKMNMFMTNNMEIIADELLKDPSMKDRGKDIIPWLEDMKKYGHVAVTGKELDVVRGYSSALNVSDLVPFSDISGTARVTQIQSMNSHPLVEESMFTAGELLPKSLKIKGEKNFYKKLGIKPGLGVTTPEGYRLGKDTMFGFTAKVKHMTPEEFNGAVKAVYEDENIQKAIYDNILKDTRIKADYEEIKKAAKLISQSGGVYEDTGVIDIALAEVLTPRAISHEKVYNPSKDLKLGSTITPGTLLGVDVKGNPITYKGDRAVVRNIKDNEVLVQLNGKFNSIKLNAGGSEKFVASAPNADNLTDRMKVIMSKVHQHISGGASVIFNPNVKGHISTNTVLIPSINAIGEAINSDKDAEVVNKAFKKLAPNVNMQFAFDEKRGGYIGIHTPSKVSHANTDPYGEIVNAINGVRNGDSKLSKNIDKNIKQLENEKIGLMDLFVSQDNTLERATGTSASARSANAIGVYREFDEGVFAEYDGTYFKNLIREESDMILEANEIKGRQVSNIYAAYSHSAGQGIDNVSIKKINPKDIIAPTGMIEADMLDEMFSFENGGKKVNLYEMDLKDLDIGIELDNPFYVDPREASTEVEKKIARMDYNVKKTSKVYIPSIMPNYIDGEVSLSKTQKAQADFVRELQSVIFKEDNNRSMGYVHESVNKKYKALIDAYQFDLTSKDGLRLGMQKTKDNPGTFRVKVQKVIAPTVKNGVIDDFAYGSSITPIVDGKPTYRKSIFLNKQSLINANVDFDMLGKDIMSMQVADNVEQLNFIKKFLRDTDYSGIDFEEIKSLKELQGKLKGTEFNYTNLAEKFFDELGIESAVSRDPIIRTESYNGVLLKTAEGMQPGGIGVDPVTGKLGMKADGDGDELNVMLKSFYKDEDGKLRVKHYNDNVREELRLDIHATSKVNMARLENNLVPSLDIPNNAEELAKSKLSKNAFSLEEYRPVLKNIVASGDANFFTNETSRAIANAANLSKAIIGQTSNPGLYLGRAASEVAFEIAKTNQNEAKAYKKSIALGTLIAEQNSIDYKLTSFGKDQAQEVVGKMQNALDMGKTWDNLFNAVQSGDETKTVNALIGTMDMLDPYTTNEVTALSMLWENKDIKHTIEGKNKIAEKIISGQVTRNKLDNTIHVEEFLMDIMNTFKHEEGVKAYTSLATKQSVGALKNLGVYAPADIAQATIDLGNGFSHFNSGSMRVINSQLDGRYIASEVMLNGKEVTDGSIVSIERYTKDAEPGIYTVKSNGLNGGKHSVTLIGEDKKFNIVGDHVFDITNNLKRSGAEIIDDGEIRDRSKRVIEAHSKKIEKDILNRDLFNNHKKAYESSSEVADKTLKEVARAKVLDEYNISNLNDLHETLYNLKDYGIDNNAVLKEMNDAIRKNGTKGYQAKKKAVLLRQDALKGAALDGARYEKFMQDKVYNVIENFDSVKSILDKNKRVNLNNINKSVNLDGIIDEVAQGLDVSSDNIEIARSAGMKSAMGYFEQVDQEAFENIQSVYKNHQYNARFREEVLGWEFDKVDELLEQKDYIGAIEKLNDTRLIHSEHAGKKLGELSVDELNTIRISTYKTGISDDIIRSNNSLIDKLIDLRRNHSDIMIEDIQQPTLKNLKDNIANDMIKSINEDIIKKGEAKETAKSSASRVKSAFDTAKTKISGLSKKEKFGVGALALASIGATMLTGSHIRSGIKSINNEDESNMNNRTLPKAPPSENKVYVSDNNAINVNVKGRSPIGSLANSAEKAISSLFGNSINVNTNIQDSREDISDREVNNIMEKSIR